MFKKSLLTLLFVLIFQSDVFSKEIFYLQCPLKSEVNKTKGGLEWYTQVGRITELRFFKLQIKKSSGQIIFLINLKQNKERNYLCKVF